MPSKSTNSFDPGSLDSGVGLLHHARSSVMRSFSSLEQEYGCSEVSSPCLKQEALLQDMRMHFKYVACVVVDGLKVETREQGSDVPGVILRQVLVGCGPPAQGGLRLHSSFLPTVLRCSLASSGGVWVDP